ncbi:hypothetical protein AJ80_07843 [Polytolypa hystricis UAMH7299]|uniref:UspA domain-containing protein n=1 Tax=Polytolypa hystricis (strain UAMH7299) TaxID=1447883 RepID=A0A2B7XIC4_POLH7|nr:hypothetical protein AJ80_07843 [Polytolypa hystricis UAMH7299]
MSLEAALDEERLQILDILEGRPAHSHSSSRPRHASPTPPVRSMLDVSTDGAQQRPGGASGSPSGRTASTSNVRSMLEPVSPSPLRLTHSAAASPTSQTSYLHDKNGHRRASEATTIGLPEIKKKEVNIDQDYQFDMLPSIPHHALPKRVTQGGKLGSSTNNSAMHASSMAAVISGADLGSIPGYSRGRDYRRHNSSVGAANQSRSPSAHRLARSQSPGTKLLGANSTFTPGKFYTDSGKMINMDMAYRKLSDAALSRAGGSLAHLPKKPTSGERGDGDAQSENGDTRLPKDDYPDAHSDDDDTTDVDSSSGEEDWKSEMYRGRRRSRKKSDADAASDGAGSQKGREKKTKSLLAAAEEESKRVSSSYKVRSLLEPVPVAGKQAPKKTGVHPHTSFDYAGSMANTPVGSEDEAEYSDIKKAQNLSIYMSQPDHSIPNRVIRTIVRGEFTSMQEEANQGRRRLRKYLVATDLSEEAVYALEWTIGTILRDGDTLYAVYAVDEETGTGAETSAVQIGEGAKAILDAADIVVSQTESTEGNPAKASLVGPIAPVRASSTQRTGSDSKSGSIDSRNMSKAEMERIHAVEMISQTCIKLLRKTRLQVRVAVEVIHCKSPKHLITEAIDGLEPTLVILGSRGRSAIKGVLLGSFSNYIVTKSSVPVMVARKKLRKHAKLKTTNVRLSNNLTTPKKLAFAKID